MVTVLYKLLGVIFYSLFFNIFLNPFQALLYQYMNTNSSLYLLTVCMYSLSTHTNFLSKIVSHCLWLNNFKNEINLSNRSLQEQYQWPIFRRKRMRWWNCLDFYLYSRLVWLSLTILRVSHFQSCIFLGARRQGQVDNAPAQRFRVSQSQL